MNDTTSELTIIFIACVLLAVWFVVSVLMPIDEGQELSRLATAGIMRGLS